MHTINYDTQNTAVAQPTPTTATSFAVSIIAASPPDVPILVDNQDIVADPSILEALRNPKERLFVLKLGETMETLISERRQVYSLDVYGQSRLIPVTCLSANKPYLKAGVAAQTTYQRLLVHRCSAYYRLTLESDGGTKSISVIATPDSRMCVYF